MSSALESLIYRNQLVDFTDPAKFVDSTAQLVGGMYLFFYFIILYLMLIWFVGLRNIFEDKQAAAEEDVLADDLAEVDDALSKMVEHPNMKILPAGMRPSLIPFIRLFFHFCSHLSFFV